MVCEPISATGRNITADNWFTSVEICEQLLNKHSITLLVTIRKNKQLPTTYSLHNIWFSEDCTLASHIPRGIKNVLLISYMHDDDNIDEMRRVRQK